MSAFHPRCPDARRGRTWVARMAISADVISRDILNQFFQLLLIALLLALAQSAGHGRGLVTLRRTKFVCGVVTRRTSVTSAGTGSRFDRQGFQLQGAYRFVGITMFAESSWFCQGAAARSMGRDTGNERIRASVAEGRE